MSQSSKTFTVGPGPHWRASASLTRIHVATIVALVPVAVMGASSHAFGEGAVALTGSSGLMNRVIEELVIALGLNAGVLWFFGMLGTVALGMGLATLVEYGLQVAMRQPYRATDGHGALMGMILALLMPPSVPWWVLAVGVVVAILIGKQVYGGIGGYPLHPAMVGWLVLLLSWPHHVYPVGSTSIAAAGGAALWVTLGGGAVLWGLGIIRPQITLGMLGGVLLGSVLFASKLSGTPLEQVMTGHVVLGAFFIATDATTSPANRRAMWAYGAGIGLLVVLIRAFGVWPDAVPFAVVLMNIANPLLDRWHPEPVLPPRPNFRAVEGAKS